MVGRIKVNSGTLDEILIALLNGKIIGYCQWEGEHFGPFGVSEKARNKRVGAKLFTEAVRRIRQAEGRTVWFNWADENAARFYGRHGLKETRKFAILRKDL
jgi:mycothiol synthase